MTLFACHVRVENYRRLCLQICYRML